MDKIEQCVSDVVAIANGARDHEQAKARIKELLDNAKFQSGQRFSTAHRLRDQLRAVYNDGLDHFQAALRHRLWSIAS